MKITFDSSIFISEEEIPVTVDCNVYEELDETDPKQSCYPVADIDRIVGEDGTDDCAPADQHGYLEDEALVVAEGQAEARMIAKWEARND